MEEIAYVGEEEILNEIRDLRTEMKSIRLEIMAINKMLGQLLLEHNDTRTSKAEVV